MEKVKFCIIVPVLQTENILKLFIDSLFDTVQFSSYVIFVDDGSPASSKKLLSECKDRKNKNICGIKILENLHSSGCAKCINKALASLPECDIVTFLDSDLILTEFWQKYVLKSFENPDTGIVGGILLYPQTEGIQCCGITFNRSIGRHLYLNNKIEFVNLKQDFEIQTTVFAFCNIRSSLINRAGNLDENFFNGYEDWDYQFRIRQFGYKAVTNPNIKVYHWETSCGPHRTFNRKSNLGLFWIKHSSFIKSDTNDFLIRNIADIQNKFIVVDMCEGRSETDLIKKMLEDSHLLTEYLDYSHYVFGNTIWLPQVFNSTFFLKNQPILYLVDNFLKLMDNQYWWSLRSEICDKDIIVDLYANVLPFRLLSENFWPGKKIR